MNARSYELIVFDWDGTLMDSAAKIVHCFERAFIDAGVAYPGADAVRRIIGLGLKEAITALMPGAESSQCLAVGDRYRENFLALDAEAMSLFPGVRQGLHALTERGHLLAIATGKSRRGLDRVLGHTSLSEFFVATRCADEALSKPHPRMLEDILEYTGLTPAQAVMVGDTTYDMLMAKAANMAGLAVSYGVHPPEELMQHGALACCESFDEVLSWLLPPRPDRSAEAARS
jgi:phosphoglycolate phosphatase